MNVSDHKDSERMIYALTNKVVRRLASIPQVVMSKEDIEQELWIAWCKARDKFDADRGIPWPAYLQRGMKHHINRVIDAQIERFEGQTFALSLDHQMGDDGDTTLGDIVPCGDMLATEIVERESNYQNAIMVMSDRAKIFVTILREQPQELLTEVQMAQDKAEVAKKVGAPFCVFRHLTASMVFDLMGANRNERAKIKKEVENLGVRISA